jgi:aminomethyltransferase
LEVRNDQIVRPGPPKPSVIMRPGMSTLAPGEERYTVPGGGAIAVPIHAGDIVRLVDAEGMQRCEVVCADATGAIDPAILGARGISDASGLKQILSGTGESARFLRSGLERRGMNLAGARAITLFGGESRPGDTGEFTVSRDGLLIVAAPGAPMDVGSQDTATPIRVHILRNRIRPANEMHLPEPLADPLQDIRVNKATAEAYVVRAGEFIQIIDVAGRQCTDFQCFAARKLDKGLEHPLDVTTTRSLMGKSYPLPGLCSKAFD